MEKPVIILGGPLLGSLLALRMKEIFPDLNFILFQERDFLEESGYWAFSEIDCGPAFRWIKPLVSKSWDQYRVILPSFKKWIKSPYHLIQTSQLHKKVSLKLGDQLKLGQSISPELVLKNSEFIIDTRQNGFLHNIGFRNVISLYFEATENHDLTVPVIMDVLVHQMEKGRSVAYYPLSDRELIVTDTWLSSQETVNVDHMRASLCEAIDKMGWRINKIIREDYFVGQVPLTTPVFREEARIINLGGLIHDTTGCHVAMASDLIERIVATSFRLGELKKIVKDYRSDCEPSRSFLRGLNNEIFSGEESCFYEALYSQPRKVIERYARGKMNMTDRYRISILKSHLRVVNLMRQAFPLRNHSWIQLVSQQDSRKEMYRNWTGS